MGGDGQGARTLGEQRGRKREGGREGDGNDIQWCRGYDTNIQGESKVRDTVI